MSGRMERTDSEEGKGHISKLNQYRHPRPDDLIEPDKRDKKRTNPLRKISLAEIPDNEKDPDSGRKIILLGLAWKTDSESLRKYFTKFGEVVKARVLYEPSGYSRGFGFVTFKEKKSCQIAMDPRSKPHLVDGRFIEPQLALPREVSHKLNTKRTAEIAARKDGPSPIRSVRDRPDREGRGRSDYGRDRDRDRDRHRDRASRDRPRGGGGRERDRGRDPRGRERDPRNRGSAGRAHSPSAEGRKLFIGKLPPDIERRELREYFSRFGIVEDCYIPKHRITGNPRGFGFVTYVNKETLHKVLAHPHHVLRGHELIIDIPAPKGVNVSDALKLRLNRRQEQQKRNNRSEGILKPSSSSSSSSRNDPSKHLSSPSSLSSLQQQQPPQPQMIPPPHLNLLAQQKPQLQIPQPIVPPPNVTGASTTNPTGTTTTAQQQYAANYSLYAQQQQAAQAAYYSQFNPQQYAQYAQMYSGYPGYSWPYGMSPQQQQQYAAAYAQQQQQQQVSNPTATTTATTTTTPNINQTQLPQQQQQQQFYNPQQNQYAQIQQQQYQQQQQQQKSNAQNQHQKMKGMRKEREFKPY